MKERVNKKKLPRPINRIVLTPQYCPERPEGSYSMDYAQKTVFSFPFSLLDCTLLVSILDLIKFFNGVFAPQYANIEVPYAFAILS